MPTFTTVEVGDHQLNARPRRRRSAVVAAVVVVVVVVAAVAAEVSLVRVVPLALLQQRQQCHRQRRLTFSRPLQRLCHRRPPNALTSVDEPVADATAGDTAGGCELLLL